MQDNSFITKMTGRGELPIGKMPGFEPPDDETHEIILERFKKQMRKETVSTVFWTIMSLFFIITYIVMYFRMDAKADAKKGILVALAAFVVIAVVTIYKYVFIDKNILYAIFKIENVFINIYFIGGVIKIKKYVSLFIFLLVLLIPIQVFAEYQQFVRRSDTFKVGQYGQFEQCVVINKDLSTKVISFNSWGNYAVKNNNGYSITMVSRKHEKKNNKLYIYLTVKGYDFNTKKYSSNYNFSFTISS